jgi:DNA-3-methyladenine glycosylase I
VKEKEVARCPWGSDALMLRYHDEEWGVPVHDDRTHFEFLVLEMFQAGLSWMTVLRKRPAFIKAFAGFDPKKVAAFGEKDIARLLGRRRYHPQPLEDRRRHKQRP